VSEDGWSVALPKPRALRHDISEALRAAIRGRKLQPGERIIEGELAERFGVSRQPVREAIRMLEREGLLTSVPNRGTFVTRVTVEDSLAICDVREELEGLAARLAVANLTPADQARLREIPTLMRQAALAKDVNRLVSLDIELHDLIVGRSNHHLLQDVLASIAVYSRGFIVHTKAYYGAALIEIADSHAHLVEEVLTLDPRRAEAAAQEHIREAASRLRRTLRQQSAG
jgi:DNA-binding GntR family transcriptional regulator